MKYILIGVGLVVLLVAAPALAQESLSDPLDPSFWENLFGVTGMVAAALVIGWKMLGAGARLIPDSATGALGFLRWLLRVIAVEPPDNTN